MDAPVADTAPDEEVSADRIQAMAQENEERWTRWTAEYDPARGIGCYGSREPLQMAKGEPPVYLPEPFHESELAEKIRAAGTFERCKEEYGLSDAEHAALYQHFLRARAFYDPEFWFEAACTIQVKRGDEENVELDTSGSDWGAAVDYEDEEQEVFQAFVLRPPQRRFLTALLEDFFSGRPVRWNLVKARQWGGSTLVQLFMAWVQQLRRKGWNIAIVADVQGQALHIRGMYDTLRRFYPNAFGSITFKPYQGMTTVKRVPEREANLGVASTRNPDAVRAYTYHMLHLSEVGFWKSTTHQNAENLAQSLEGGLVDGSYTLCVRESTAKGVGNYFHREYLSAERGDSPYSNFFVGWHEIEDYTMAVEDVNQFVRSWAEYEWWLWDQGATIEGIRWYRYRKGNMPSHSAEWRMKAEYPTTADEAFQSTGRRVFSPNYVENARRTCKPAPERGRMQALGRKGENALEDLSFEPHDQGDIEVWRQPGDDYGGLLDLVRYRVRGRHCAFMDIGARWEGGDYHVVTIIDRAPMLWGAEPEVVAQYRGHLDQDLAAWYAVQLCAWYEGALLAIEKNSLNRKRDDDSIEPDTEHSLTVLDEIREVYERNLFHTVERDKKNDETYRKFGFHTSRESKSMIMDALNAALRDEAYVERSDLACDEMDYYEVKDDGRLGAKEGQHDDLVISRAGAVWLALHHMDPPKKIERDRETSTPKPSMARFS